MDFKEYLAYSELQMNFPNLAESPVAFRGDYNFKDAIAGIADTGIDLKWKLKGKIKTLLGGIGENGVLDVYKNKEKDIYIVGEFSPRPDDEESTRFNVYCELHIRLDKVKGKVYHAVSTVKTKGDAQFNGVATELYKFLVQNEKLTLISDAAQFFGARRLWASLSKKFVVDVLDIESGDVIKKNVKIQKETKDGNFDKDFWSDGDSQDYSKEDIRFILRALKT